MAEIIVRVINKVNKDFYLNCKCTKRGDVISVCPDGWSWGSAELTSPEYRILVFPNLTVDDVSPLTVPEKDIDPKNPSKTLQKRAFKLDLDSPLIPKEMVNALNDNTRKNPLIKLSVPFNVLLIKVAKPSIQDIAVFGLSPNIF